MGEIVAAAVVSHVPTIMLPEETRKNMDGGTDTSIAASMQAIREGLNTTKADTLVIFDTHWFTTVEHLVAGAEISRACTRLKNCRISSQTFPTIIPEHQSSSSRLKKSPRKKGPRIKCEESEPAHALSYPEPAALFASERKQTLSRDLTDC